MTNYTFIGTAHPPSITSLAKGHISLKTDLPPQPSTKDGE